MLATTSTATTAIFCLFPLHFWSLLPALTAEAGDKSHRTFVFSFWSGKVVGERQLGNDDDGTCLESFSFCFWEEQPVHAKPNSICWSHWLPTTLHYWPRCIYLGTIEARQNKCSLLVLSYCLHLWSLGLRPVCFDGCFIWGKNILCPSAAHCTVPCDISVLLASCNSSRISHSPMSDLILEH